MKVGELLLESKLSYKPKSVRKEWGIDRASYQTGKVKDWMKAGNVGPEDIKKAVDLIQKTPEFNAITKRGFIFDSSPTQLKNGTLSFTAALWNAKMGSFSEKHYLVYPNGLIRGDYYDSRYYNSKNTSNTRLKSPKPRMTVGDPVRSLLATYKVALEELFRKLSKIPVDNNHLPPNDVIVKSLLRRYKRDPRWAGKSILNTIKILRGMGKNLPEFKVIEKSIRANQKT
jgi:hypothetical protein